jgi:hypothetical protein
MANTCSESELSSWPSGDAARLAIPGGFLLVLEGLGGSGKSTLAGTLAERLGTGGWVVTRTREPGGTPFGAILRDILLGSDGSLAPWAEAFLFEADRAQTFRSVTKPALARGEVVSRTADRLGPSLTKALDEGSRSSSSTP